MYSIQQFYKFNDTETYKSLQENSALSVTNGIILNSHNVFTATKCQSTNNQAALNDVDIKKPHSNIIEGQSSDACEHLFTVKKQR
jgi:hypothetical protein